MNISESEFGGLAIELGALKSDVASLSKRIKALELQAHGSHSRHDTPTWTEWKLNERLAELESTAIRRDMARGMDFEQVHPEEMRRLRRIEIAARQFKAWLRPGETTALHRESSILEPLWEALER